MIEWTVATLRTLLEPMRDTYRRGGNAMACARKKLATDQNHIVATLISYDLQSGSYTSAARAHPDRRMQWCTQLAGILAPLVEDGATILEAGCGEGTTLSGVLKCLDQSSVRGFGFDLSWSRLAYAQPWFSELTAPRLFTADLFNIPLPDASIDVVYTSHSLEPNGGREHEALSELVRIARRAVVLVEPIFELASEAGKQRMAAHGYVRGLRREAEKFGRVTDLGLLPYCSEPLNPSGAIIIELDRPKVDGPKLDQAAPFEWRCPVTGHALREEREVLYCEQAGLAYPVIKGIPVLLAHYAIIASHFDAADQSTDAT